MDFFLVVWITILSVHQSQCCHYTDGYFGWVCHPNSGCFCKDGQVCQKTLSPNCPGHCVDNPWGIGCTDEKVNLALGKTTTQSSSHNVSYQSSLAVDGNNSTDASLCARTYWETNPWWLVDLGGLYVIRSVVVIMPNNCSTGASFSMYIGNDTYNHGDTQFLNTCAFEQAVDPPALGRYVKISGSGSQSLVLCEVIVRGYTYPYNIALGKTASQSTNFTSGSLARVAVDGNTNTRFNGGSCTHTEENGELSPWWEVDLGDMYYIYSVTLVNRENVGRRLKNIEIKLSLPNNSVYHCARREEQVPDDASVELPCNPVPLIGQFVRVSLNNTTPDVLTLCEVMVKGYKYQDCGNSKTFGPECRYKCNCKDTSEVCEGRTGACASGCADGWSNRQNVCEIECPFGKFGPLCEYTCHCLGDFTCSVTNGFSCPEGCQTYWKGYGCHQQRPYFDMAPTVTSRTLHSASIRWDSWSSGRYPGEGSVRSYVARVWKDGNVIDVRKKPDDTTSITIENLLEYTAYEFTVSIEDEEGQEGKQSPRVAKMTCGVPVIIPQPDLIPSLKVPWNTAQIRLKTHDMTERVHRCDGFAKLKLYVNREYGNNIRKDVVDVKESQDIYIEDLIPYSNFTVNISAVNNLNLEGPVLVLNGQTPEGVPPKMAPPTVVSRSKDSIELTWEAPWPPGGIITEYDIGYTMEVTNWKVLIVSSDTRGKSIGNLEYNTTHWFRIRAKTNLGYGEYSDTIETITAEGKPGPPSNFNATRRSETSLEFSWKAPRVRNGKITGYKIECYTDGKGFSAEVSMHARSHVFKQLTSGTKHTCSLKAKTSAGYGNSSQLVTWTEPKDPDIGGIVGGAVGATFVSAFVVMAILVILLRRRRREREANSSSSVPEREVSNLGLEPRSEDTDYEHPMRHWQETLYTDLALSSNDDVEQSGTGNLGEDRSRY